MARRKGSHSNNRQGGNNKPAKPKKKRKKREAEATSDDDDDDDEFITKAATTAASASTAATTNKKYKEKDIFHKAVVDNCAKAAVKAKKENQKSNGKYRLPHQWLQKRVEDAKANPKYAMLNLAS